MVYLAKGGFWLTLVQVIGAASAFALSVVFARSFPKDSYGTYKYIIALSGIIGTFTLTGLGPAITQSVARGYDGALHRGFKTVLRWGTIIVIISFTLAVYYALHHNYLLSYSLVLIGITSPLIDATSFFGSYLTGKKDFKLLSLLNAAGSVFPALCLITTLFFTINLPIVITVYFISSVIIMYASYFYTTHLYRPEGTEDPEMISYGKHLTFITILNTIADQADKVIVYHYVGAVELAVYTFATAIPTQIKGVLKGVSPLAFPKFAIKSLDEVKRNTPSRMLRFLFVIIPIVIIYILCAPYIYRFFFPRYIDAISMSRVFSLSLLAYISIIPTTILQAKKALPSLYGSNIIIALTKLALLFMGVSYAGVWGVVYARVVYEYAALLIALIYLKKAREAIPLI
jgi:O-antigen/teichoic acid export membrane protein